MARGDRKAVSFRSFEARMQLSAATQGNRVIYEASHSWNATMLVTKYISPMLGLTPIYEISATLQPDTIYNQPRLSASKFCYASKRKLRSDKFLGAIATCCSSWSGTFIKRYSTNRRNIDGPGNKRIKRNLNVGKANLY